MGGALRSRVAGLAVLAALVAPLALTGCDPETFAVSTIRYEQVGGCAGIVTGAGLRGAGVGRAYVAFKIHSIENRTENARDFSFDANKVYLVGQGGTYVELRIGDRLENPFAIDKVHRVPAGTTAELNGVVYASVDNPGLSDGAATSGEGEIRKYLLGYETPAGTQGVLFDNVRVHTEQYPYRGDCQALQY